MDDQQKAPCGRCSDALRTGEQHARCPDPACGCVCRDLAVDLQYPDVRLRVALLCQQALGTELVAGDQPEARFLNGRVQDLLWGLLQEMMGLGRPVEPIEQPACELAGEVQLLTAFVGELEQVLGSGGLERLRAVLHPPVERPARRAVPEVPPPPRRRQPEPLLEEEPEFEDADDAEQDEAPPLPAKANRRRPAGVRRAPPPQDMPTGSAMTAVTMAQASSAAAQGERQLNRVERSGGATGSSRNQS